MNTRLVTLSQYNIVLRFTVNNKEVRSYLYIPGLNQHREFSHICKSWTWIKNKCELVQPRETPPIKVEKNPHVSFRLRVMFCTVAALQRQASNTPRTSNGGITGEKWSRFLGVLTSLMPMTFVL